jgi:hypothetical protein
VSKPKVYFDTSSINHLCENFSRRSKRIFKDYEIYLSGSHFDEIIQTPSVGRIQEISSFLWKVSNKLAFQDKGRLVELETNSVLSGVELNTEDYFYPKREVYISALKDLSKGRLGEKSILALNKIKDKKKISFDQSKRRRTEWRDDFDGEHLPDSWNEMFRVLTERRSFNRRLCIDLQNSHVLSIYNENNIMDLNYKELTCTAIGLEYFFAFRFVTESGIVNESLKKKYAEPTPGELFDNTHVYYAGLVDYFVTDDNRMAYIMKDLLNIDHPVIISSNEFIRIAQK